MDSKDGDHDVFVALMTVSVLAIASVLLVFGIGIQKVRSQIDTSPLASAAAAVAAAPAAESPRPSLAGDASVVVEGGVVKFYFASGKADLAEGALGALVEAIEAARSGKRLVLSGFHDATGNPAANAELAKQRALAVRDALVGAGVAESSLGLMRPTQTEGGANLAQARRVEVSVED